jgi:hypothetical protein
MATRSTASIEAIEPETPTTPLHLELLKNTASRGQNNVHAPSRDPHVGLQKDEVISRSRTKISNRGKHTKAKWWEITLFRGMMNDVKRRAPFYVSDWTDAWDYRVVPATVYMYFAKYALTLILLLVYHSPQSIPLQIHMLFS